MTISSPAARDRPNGAWVAGALLFALIAVLGSFIWPYVLSPGHLSPLVGAAAEKAALVALLLGSAVALGVAIALIKQVSVRHRTRSWISLALTALAAVIALPGLCVGGWLLFWFVYSQLPLTSSEMHAVEMAERFVYRNGYTAAGHPKELPVLLNDIMDPLAGSEENLLAMRKGTLEARAFGVRISGSDYLVFFESIPPSTYGAYQTVEVSGEGNARILHQEMFPGMYKRTKR